MRFGNRRLRVYYDKAQQLLECFTDIKIAHVPRKENSIADADANLATALAVNGGQSITVKVEERCVIPNSYFEEDDEGKVTSDVVTSAEISVDDWRIPFIQYLRYGRLPDDPQEKDRVRRRVGRFDIKIKRVAPRPSNYNYIRYSMRNLSIPYYIREFDVC